jgi:uncharacterized protein
MEKLPAFFKLKVRGLANGTHPVDISASASDLDVPIFHGNIRVHGEIIVSERLQLHLHIETTGTFICDRCAIEFDRAMTHDIEIFYIAPQLAKDSEENDYIHVFDPLYTNEIDFTEDIRDALILSIPMKILHDPDCQGVDLGGEPIRMDERMAKLGSLYERLREEEMNSEAGDGVSQG